MAKKIPAGVKLHLEKFIDFTADNISEAIIKKIGEPKDGAVLETISIFFEREDYQYGIKNVNFLYNGIKTKCKIDTYSFTKNRSTDSDEDDKEEDYLNDGLGVEPEKSLDDDDDDFSEDDDFDDFDNDFDKDDGFGDDDDDFGEDDFFASISFFSNIIDWFAETFKFDIDELKLFGGSKTIGDRVFAFVHKKALLKAVNKIESKGIKFSASPQLVLSTHDYQETINENNYIEWRDTLEKSLKDSAAIETFAVICFDTDEFRKLLR